MKRIEFRIRRGAFWLGATGDGRHWTDIKSKALAFGSSVEANLWALGQLGLVEGEYVVEEIEG